MLLPPKDLEVGSQGVGKARHIPGHLLCATCSLNCPDSLRGHWREASLAPEKQDAEVAGTRWDVKDVCAAGPPLGCVQEQGILPNVLREIWGNDRCWDFS